MELYVRTQFEAPKRGVDLLPRDGQCRHDFKLVVVAHQRIVYPEVGRDVQAFVLRVWIKSQNVALTGPLEGFGTSNRWKQKGCCQRGSDK